MDEIGIVGKIMKMMINWKKLLIFGVTNITINLLTSCEIQDGGSCTDPTYKETNYNKSDYALKIKVWLNDQESFITLKNGNFEVNDINLISFSDSLLIIFDNKKKVSYRNEINVLDPNERYTEECTLFSTYIFTNENYENAEDCNGDCE